MAPPKNESELFFPSSAFLLVTEIPDIASASEHVIPSSPTTSGEMGNPSCFSRSLFGHERRYAASAKSSWSTTMSSARNWATLDISLREWCVKEEYEFMRLLGMLLATLSYDNVSIPFIQMRRKIKNWKRRWETVGWEFLRKLTDDFPLPEEFYPVFFLWRKEVF